MAARTALVSIVKTRISTLTTRTPILSIFTVKPPQIPCLTTPQRSLHSTPFLSANAPIPPNPSAVSSDSSDSFVKTPTPTPVPDATPDETRNAAYLGEADRDDGFESFKDAYGKPPESLDAKNAAFLGEADSDDGFESSKDIDGEKFEAVDASQSAYLGEADSDDGFESDKDINPERHVHKIEDASSSGVHGQPGEGDQ